MAGGRLRFERSPYLLQHATDPVDWFPWGDEAFERARADDKLVFLSIGYSTCHWCHVMHRESFKDPEVAAVLNAHYVAVKVDREEHPDVDAVYMTVAQAMTGRGGWPLTVFLTPEGLPVYAGTYFPKTRRFGLIGLVELLERLSHLWRTEREQVLSVAKNAERGMQALFAFDPRPFEASLIDEAYRALKREFDPEYGGFGRAPKFPFAHRLIFLWRYATVRDVPEASAMAEKTIHMMQKGAIRDHLGGGWMRYATDRAWRVPHFEKMLYDQALMALALVESYDATGEAAYRALLEETLRYALEALGAPEGGFWTAQDADVDGEEGAYYVFTPDEVARVLGAEDAAVFCAAYDIQDGGPIDGKSAPNTLFFDAAVLAERFGLTEAALREKLARHKAVLRRYRDGRHRLFTDDKILSGPNGLMIAALARAGAKLGGGETIARAERAYAYLLDHLVDEAGRLYVRYRDGERKTPATLDDVASVAWGALELFFATMRPAYFAEVRRWADVALDRFAAPEGGFALTMEGAPMGVRVRKAADGALPSGNAMMAYVLAHLVRLSGSEADAKALSRLLDAFAGLAVVHPADHAFLLTAAMLVEWPGIEVVIVGERGAKDTEALLTAVRGLYMPQAIVFVRPPEGAEEAAEWDRLLPDTAVMRTLQGRAAAYVCERMSCRAPTSDPGALREALLSAGARARGRWTPPR
ncbi:MAG: thioredoxin domain-containing protein [Hydrogenibacillus sp.]|nr:thioredoxin domain-containing protein [Hydrogenibacillus sp.]